MLSFEKLYSQFLSSISSYTLSNLRDDEIQAELFNLAERAIASFKFPKIPLSYYYDEEELIHFFSHNVTQKELNIIISYMLLYWVEFQLNHEQRLQNLYYDDNVRTFSMGNILAQLNRLHENFTAKVKREEYDYGRVDAAGRPNLGNLNG